MDTKEIISQYNEKLKKDRESIEAVNSMIIASSGLSSLMDKSSKAKISASYEARRRESQRQKLIRENTCPICSGKLIRGKRNKNKEYKREWTCSTCSSGHYI